MAGREWAKVGRREQGVAKLESLTIRRDSQLEQCYWSGDREADWFSPAAAFSGPRARDHCQNIFIKMTRYQTCFQLIGLVTQLIEYPIRLLNFFSLDDENPPVCRVNYKPYSFYGAKRSSLGWYSVMSAADLCLTEGIGQQPKKGHFQGNEAMTVVRCG